MDTTFISQCCKAEALEVNTIDEHTYECDKCGQTCFVEEVCAECLGTGEVWVDHDDTKPCLCQVEIHDGDGDDD